MRTGIYGGTFNPVHNGHINILRGFYEKLNLDRIIVIPARVPPHKEAHSLASEDDRMNMLQLALTDIDMEVIISDIELLSEGKSYTYITLSKLREMYPDDEFYLLMGEDMFLIIDKWMNSEYIMRNAVICGSNRSSDGQIRMREYADNLQQQRDYFRYRVVEIPFIDVSSTQIRECADDFSAVSELVPRDVAEYITKNHLYHGGD